MAERLTLDQIKADHRNSRPVRIISDGYEIVVWCNLGGYGDDTYEGPSMGQLAVESVMNTIDILGGQAAIEDVPDDPTPSDLCYPGDDPVHLVNPF